MQFPKKKNKNNNIPNKLKEFTLGIKIAVIPVRIEKIKQIKDEFFFLYPPKYSQIAPPTIEPVVGPTRDTKEYILDFASFPSSPSTFSK